MKQIKSFLYFVWKYKWLAGFFAIIFFAFWANTFHTRFPDEFDNIVGGWYIIHGHLPYTGFFSHHNPGAYYVAAIITLLTRQSFVSFRLVWGILLWLTLTSSFLFLRRKFGISKTNFFLLYIFLLAIAATYYWAQMLLSETIVGYMFIPAFALVFLKYIDRQKLTQNDIIFISITTAIALLTSLTFIFSIGIFLAFVMWVYARENGLFSRKTLTALGILAAPYLLFVIYLVLTGGLSEYYFQSILYNRDYYIYNFPTVDGKINTNPARYAFSIFYNVGNQFYSLLLQARDFNLGYPVNVTLLLGNVALIIYLTFQRQFLLAGVLYFILTFLNARSEPLSSKETDFHATVYVMLSFLNFSYVIFNLKNTWQQRQDEATKLISKGLFLLIVFYGFFMTAFFARSFSEKVYTKLMGQAPAIYDEPVVAPIINKIVTPNEYFWIGPFEFQELLYINSKLPSKYHWFLPANVRSEKIRTEIITDFTKNRPKLIVFKEDYATFGVTPAEFNYPIVNFLREHYFRLRDLKEDLGEFELTITGLHNFDIAENFYFDKDRKAEIVELLLKQNIIKAKLK